MWRSASLARGTDKIPILINLHDTSLSPTLSIILEFVLGNVLFIDSEKYRVKHYHGIMVLNVFHYPTHWSFDDKSLFKHSEHYLL